MKKIMLLLPIMILGIGCFDKNIDTEPNAGTIIDFKDDTTIIEINNFAKQYNINLHPNSKVFSQKKIVISDQIINVDVLAAMAKSNIVEGVGVNQIFFIDPLEMHPGTENLIVSHAPTHTYTNLPNDPLYLEGKQWNFDLIGMPAVWDKLPKVSLGKNIVVAVIDTGVSDGEHSAKRVPDLANTCIMQGYNFVNDNTDAYDGHGHGTHVAGTIAQSTNNGIGVAGIAPQSCILPIKVLSDEGSGTAADIADGIYFAVDAGAQVINLSIGSTTPSPVIALAVKYAADHNVFLACAAGNSSKNIINYPAGHPGCHAITAVDKNGELAWYSSHGESSEGAKVFLAAPGGDTRDGIDGGIWQDTIDPEDITKHGYFPFQGTSMASPHVAGIAALVMSNLDHYDLSDIEKILANTATDKADVNKYGYGLVNAQKAVTNTIKHNKTRWAGSVLLGIFVLGGIVAIKKYKK